MTDHSPAPRAATPRPRAPEYAFDPTAALGWKNIGLDGLGCFLRSVEAVLVGHGYGGREIAQGMAVPLDLVRRGEWYGPMSEFPACTVRWQLAGIGEGDRQWPLVVETLASGAPVVLMPDGFHWPGDEYEGREHFHHHMVLAHRLDGQGLHLLDIDAPAAEGYRRIVEVDAELRMSASRIALVEDIAPPRRRPAEEVAEALLPSSLTALAEDIAELRAFHGRVWSGGPLPVLVAKGMDVLVLGDIQPQLFLLGHALADAREESVRRVSQAALTAAGRAQKLGLLLLGLHRFQAEGVYAVAHEEISLLADSLEGLLGEMHRWHGSGRPATTETDGARITRRLLGETQWCFGAGKPLENIAIG
ncbi:hypothetical protein MTQ01_04440 [Streptomyces sp. XM4193]|uniref:hypothetical protein n=1 Tax=Streptomyces sp. XM4193 TaxID=2929782 RepID=UPI001FF9C241|nr:hypothetical protein [Streptomyces sp. XM4193]MCK1795268.1 hypothetical protein [Streptomyces sp. XM4193]